MKDYTVTAIVVAAIFALILFAMWFGWRARRQRDVQLGAYAAPEALPTPDIETAAFYVATTKHDEPLERLSLRSLRFRARARIAVSTEGLAIEIPGEQTAWIPAAALRGAGPATYTIDRVVERDGLVCVTWALNGSGDLADSYLRLTLPADRERVLRALADILRAAPGADIESEA